MINLHSDILHPLKKLKSTGTYYVPMNAYSDHKFILCSEFYMKRKIK